MRDAVRPSLVVAAADRLRDDAGHDLSVLVSDPLAGEGDHEPLGGRCRLSAL